jgi:ABC-type glycerol-3-phosphate transport system permease component
MKSSLIRWPVIKYVVLATFVIWTILPISIVVLTSFKRDMDIFQVPFSLMFKPTLKNYARAFSTGDFPLYFRNSVIVAVSSSILSVILGLFAAYGLTCFKLKSTRAISNLFLLLDLQGLKDCFFTYFM